MAWESSGGPGSRLGGTAADVASMKFTPFSLSLIYTPYVFLFFLLRGKWEMHSNVIGLQSANTTRSLIKGGAHLMIMIQRLTSCMHAYLWMDLMNPGRETLHVCRDRISLLMMH
jgi:hypothetical protein